MRVSDVKIATRVEPSFDVARKPRLESDCEAVTWISRSELKEFSDKSAPNPTIPAIHRSLRQNVASICVCTDLCVSNCNSKCTCESGPKCTQNR